MNKHSGSIIILFGLIGLGIWWLQQVPAFTENCIHSEHDLVICGASNMARYGRVDPILNEHPDFDLRKRSIEANQSQQPSASLQAFLNQDELHHQIKLVAARNESVAFQLVFRRTDDDAPTAVDINVGEWSDSAKISTEISQAHYHWVDKGGYTWGPKSPVKKWPAAYPDALIPQQHGCLGQREVLFDSVVLPDEKHKNQAVWFDSFIDATTPAGTYYLKISIDAGNKTIPVLVQLQVHDVTLPDEPSIDAVGEIYRSYNLEGAGFDRSAAQWKHMAHCYQQIAHQHRMVFIERTYKILNADNQADYVEAYHPILTGSLFTEKMGYTGPGKNTPVSVWRTPWPQELNGHLDEFLTEKDFQRYTELARRWDELITSMKWNNTAYYAYVFDEVDGPKHKGKAKDLSDEEYDSYLAIAHTQMHLLQTALDKGSPNHRLDLLWTSHSNPADWTSNPELDLSDKIRHWAPNASAAEPEFLAERKEAGDTVWFYHSGHPAVGAHSINTSGIDMRTWGVVGARYGIKGQLMWAVNLGSDERPFAEPSYKPDDDRFGNGVVVYPGNQLDKLGFAKVPGPLPSMRLKAWRRGLQDAELYFLAKAIDPEAADNLMVSMVPEALADASGKAKWPQDPASWIEFRKALLRLASKNKTTQ